MSLENYVLIFFSEMAKTNTKTFQWFLSRNIVGSKSDICRIRSKGALQNTEYKGAWQIEASSFFKSLIAKKNCQKLLFCRKSV